MCRISLFLVISSFIILSCRSKELKSTVVSNNTSRIYKTTGTIERLDDRLNNIIKPGAEIEILAEGFEWSEGPLWLAEHNKLLLSDIPANKIYQWTEANGLEPYLTPSGYTGQESRGGETGSNGLILDNQGRLVLCQHGDRRMARLMASLTEPKPIFTTLADNFEGKRLNSPNDAVYRSNGDLYFTDPPYGLEKNIEDPAKELPFQGVYRLATNGTLQLLTAELSRPNGLAFSPDEKILYVANSDPEKAIWMAYEVTTNGGIKNGRIFYDATPLTDKAKGLPDGLKINRAGYLFATGPGGVFIFDQQAHHLGTIETGQSTSNCAFDADESTLYITADDYLMRVKLK